MKKRVAAVILLLSLALIVFGLQRELKNHRYEEAVDEIPTIEEFIEEETEKELSPNVVGWIKIEETNINYPVLQGRDNYEYLNKNCYDESSLAGSIFLDSRNSRDFSDRYNLIYGHNISGIMFGSLKEFGSEEYFNTHRTGTLRAGGREIGLTAFAFLKVSGDDEVLFRLKEAEIADYAEANASIFYRPAHDHIVGLSTCINSGDDRWVLLLEILD